MAGEKANRARPSADKKFPFAFCRLTLPGLSFSGSSSTLVAFVSTAGFSDKDFRTFLKELFISTRLSYMPLRTDFSASASFGFTLVASVVSGTLSLRFFNS